MGWLTRWIVVVMEVMIVVVDPCLLEVYPGGGGVGSVGSLAWCIKSACWCCIFGNGSEMMLCDVLMVVVVTCVC